MNADKTNALKVFCLSAFIGVYRRPWLLFSCGIMKVSEDHG